jgi:hypothetical protein
MRVAWILGGWLVATAVACSSGHGHAGHPGSGGSSGVSEGGPVGAAGAGATSGDAEPAGPRVLTLVHGVVDAPGLRFCLEPAGGPVTGDPMPAGGLSFGAALVVRAVSGVDLASDALQIYAITGDDAVIAGKSCQALLAQARPDAGSDASNDASNDASSDAATNDADASDDADPPIDGGSESGGGEASAPLPPPPSLRVATLPVLPAGTLGLQSSYLLVVMGCIGQSDAFTDSLSDSVCGTGYRPDRPTLLPALVRMSRATRAGAFGLQVVNASRATPSLTLVSSPPKGVAESPITIAANVGLGAIEPASADLSHAPSDFGSPLDEATLGVSLSAVGSGDFTEPWSAALSASGVASPQGGRDYALVVIGPSPTVGGDKWWNAPLVTLVPTAP